MRELTLSVVVVSVFGDEKCKTGTCKAEGRVRKEARKEEVRKSQE